MPEERRSGDGPVMADGIDDDVIRIIEERAQVGVRRLERGGVRVSTVTETVSEALPVRLTDETVEVTRVPVDRLVETAATPRVERDGDDEITILPIYEERAVIRTELVLVEEIHIRRRRVVRDETVSVDLRRQRATVEPLADPSAIPPLEE